MKVTAKLIPALKASFPRTIPIFLGYLFLGIAFGILLTEKGYHWLWASAMAIVVFAGMGQFVAVNMLVPGVSFLNAFLLQLSLNARHIFYGLSMLEKFKGMGKLKPYMIFALTDETYSLLCSARIPEGVREKPYYFFIAVLDQSYWIIGCTLGGLIGSRLHFNSAGIDFVMTALFVTICIDQWREAKDHLPVLTGCICAAVCLLLFGPDHFILPALAAICGCLLLLRKRIEAREEYRGKEVHDDVV